MKRTIGWKRTTEVLGIAMAVMGLVLVWTPSTWAQIAAPRLNGMVNPAGRPYNPAVTVLHNRSGVVLGVLDTVVTEGPLGTTGVTVASGSGGGVKIDLVGLDFGMTLAAQSQELALDPLLGSGTVEISSNLGALSWRAGEVMTFGFGILEEKFIDPNQTEKSRTPLMGGVLKLGSFYVGGSLGEENQTRTELLPIPFEGEADRSVWNLGLAVRWREEAEGIHLQVWQQQAKGSIQGAFEIEEETTAGGIVEAIIFNIVFYFESQSTERVDSGGKVVREITDSTAGIGLDFGDGLGLLFALKRTEEVETFFNNQQEIETSIISLGWLF